MVRVLGSDQVGRWLHEQIATRLDPETAAALAESRLRMWASSTWMLRGSSCEARDADSASTRSSPRSGRTTCPASSTSTLSAGSAVVTFSRSQSLGSVWPLVGIFAALTTVITAKGVYFLADTHINQDPGAGEIEVADADGRLGAAGGELQLAEHVGPGDAGRAGRHQQRAAARVAVFTRCSIFPST